MSEFIKSAWKPENRKKILFCAIGGAAALLLLLVQLVGELPALFPTEASKQEMERELKKLEKQDLELVLQTEAADKVRNQAATIFSVAWQIAAMGEPEVELRAKIENTAKALELKLNNISTVRRTKFNDDLSILELDLSVSCDLDTLLKFFSAVEKIEPKLYWRRFDFRSENSGSVGFNGSLRCFCDERAGVSAAKPGTAEPGLEAAPATNKVEAGL